MPDAAVLAASLLLAVLVLAAGAWYLRRLWKQHQAEVARDREWDAGHGAGGEAVREEEGA